MLLPLLFLLTAATSLAATNPYNPICAAHQPEILTTGCKGPKDCIYPDPDNCSTYIACVPTDEAGNAYAQVMPCPAGLEWNDGKKWCDYPAQSTCPRDTKKGKGKRVVRYAGV